MELKKSLVAIGGPTGSGKSALALAVALAFQGEIVNYDSVQLYRGLEIGSAKTPLGERAGVPHHLLDVLAVNEELTAGAYVVLAGDCLRYIARRGAMPILVGGTGFYLRSLLEGLSAAPARNPELRERLSHLVKRRPGALHRFLRLADAGAAARIHPNDHQKLIRAVELASAGAPPTPRQGLIGFRVFKLGLNPPRGELYRRLDARSAGMFDGGLLEETAGIPAGSKVLQALGYRQAAGVLAGRMAMAEAVVELQTKTRQYAKRQLTWYRGEAEMRWLDGFGDDPGIQQQAVAIVRAELTF